MAIVRNTAFLLALPCLAGAEEVPDLALQLRMLTPMTNLRDANGGKVGSGAGLVLNIPLEDGWSWRVDMGYDRFPKGLRTGSTTTQTQVDVSHLSLEGVFQLRDVPGPYVFMGVGGYSWNVKETDSLLKLSVSRRVAHAGGSVGFGYRVTPTFDVELRGMGGRIDPSFMAGWAGIAISWRF